MQDNLPRNLIFMLSLVASAAISFFMNGVMYDVVSFFFDIQMSSKNLRALENSALWGIASGWSMFGFLVFLLAFFVPALFNIINLVRLKGNLQNLPVAGAKGGSVTKEKFLKVMSEFPFVYEAFAKPFAEFIIEEPEKNIKRKTKVITKGKAQKAIQVNIYAVAHAKDFFKIDDLLNSRLSLWFIKTLPSLIFGIGFLMFILSIVGYFQNGTEALLTDKALQNFTSGVAAFALCIGFAVLISAGYKTIIGHLYHRTKEILKLIDNLFEHNTGATNQNSELATIEVALNKTVSTFKDVTNTLNDKQEESVNAIFVETLDEYLKLINKSLADQSKSINKVVSDTAKSSENAAVQLSKRFDDYASKITEVHKQIEIAENKSQKHVSDNLEKLIEGLNKEVTKVAKMSSSKDSILNDLNKTAGEIKNLAEVSENLSQKFDDITIGLEHVLNQIGTAAPMDEGRKKELLKDLQEIRKNHKTVGIRHRKVSN